MSLITAMLTGSSALANYGESMSVIGNNLANANTMGFKRSSTSFEDQLAATMGSNGANGANQIGMGVATAAITRISKQGSFERTDSALDLAVDGTGYFMVKNTISNRTYYTRAGNFIQDQNKYLIDSNGLRLQGVNIQPGNTDTSVQDIRMTPQSIFNPTSLATVALNLNQEDKPITKAYDPNDTDTYSYSSSLKVYDSVGGGHDVEIHYRKTAANIWEWHVAAKSVDLPTASRGTGALTEVGQTIDPASEASYTKGILEFTESGLLKSEGSTPVTFNWDNNIKSNQVLFDFGDAIGDNSASGHAYDSTNDFSSYDSDPTSATYLTYADKTVNKDLGNTGGQGAVQFAMGYTNFKVTQDGYPEGKLDKSSVDPSGRIFGHFDNGQIFPLFQLTLTKFDNQAGLLQKGANLFEKTSKSGDPQVGTARATGYGVIRPYSLETSNVDMSEEFVKMIAVQRTFQANSKLVNVVDTMMDRLINLKR